MSKQSGKTEAEGQGGGGTRRKVRPPASLEGACPVGIWLLPGGSPDGPPAGLRVRRQRPARLRWPAQPVFSVQPALDQGNFAGEGLVCFLFLKSSKTLLILATNIKITKEPQSTPSHPLNVRPHRTRVGSPISSAWSQRKVGAALGQVGAMVLAWTVVAGPQERRRAAAWGSSGQRGAPSPAFSVPASSARALCLGPGARGPRARGRSCGKVRERGGLSGESVQALARASQRRWHLCGALTNARRGRPGRGERQLCAGPLPWPVSAKSGRVETAPSLSPAHARDRGRRAAHRPCGPARARTEAGTALPRGRQLPASQRTESGGSLGPGGALAQTLGPEKQRHRGASRPRKATANRLPSWESGLPATAPPATAPPSASDAGAARLLFPLGRARRRGGNYRRKLLDTREKSKRIMRRQNDSGRECKKRSEAGGGRRERLVPWRQNRGPRASGLFSVRLSPGVAGRPVLAHLAGVQGAPTRTPSPVLGRRRPGGKAPGTGVQKQRDASLPCQTSSACKQKTKAKNKPLSGTQRCPLEGGACLRDPGTPPHLGGPFHFNSTKLI